MSGGVSNSMLRGSNTMQAPVDADQVTVCRICDERFSSWDAYHKHKVESKKHIVCEICSTDFSTHEAQKQHHDLMHAAEQDLYCNKCNLNFVRMGAFIAHIELGDCKAVRSSELKNAVQTKHATRIEQENIKYAQIDGRSRFQSSSTPDAFGQSSSANNWTMGDHIGQSTIRVQQSQHIQTPPVKAQSSYLSSYSNDQSVVDELKPEFKDDDILSFNNVDEVLNSSWEKPSGAPLKFDSTVGFPTLSPGHTSAIGASITTTKVASAKILNIKPANTNGSGLVEMLSGSTTTPIPKTTVIKSSWDTLGTNIDPARDSKPLTTKTVPTCGTKLQPFAKTIPAWHTNLTSTQDNSVSADAITKPIALGTKKLFPDAPPAVAPLTEMMQGLAVDAKEDKKNPLDPLDPDNPAFNARLYYLPVIQKYKCPHKGCTKSVEGYSTFIAHLKSAAHKDAKLQCHACLRYYATATALTQHVESQGIRCSVRKSDSYEGIVDEVTGGTGLIEGTHIDDTIKYAVNSEALNAVGGISGFISRQKDAKDARDNRFNNFWNTNKTEW